MSLVISARTLASGLALQAPPFQFREQNENRSETVILLKHLVILFFLPLFELQVQG